MSIYTYVNYTCLHYIQLQFVFSCLIFSATIMRSVAQTYLRPKLGHDFLLVSRFGTRFSAFRPFQLGKYTVFHGEFESDLENTRSVDLGSKN